jgi:transcriptional regulator with XRE-family HTH domain
MAANERVCPSCRLTVLSRYNTDPVCAPCLQTTRTADTGAPTWVWDSAPIREALARGDLGAFLALLRAGADLSQLDLAALVEGWSQSTVSLVERGKRDTLYDIRELLRVTGALGVPREALLPLLLGEPYSTPDGKGDVEPEGEVDMDRRSFTRLTAAAVVGTALPATRIPSRVEPAHVRYIRGCLDRLRRQDRDLGGGVIVRQAARQYAWARRMLDESDYTDAVGRELLNVTAELAITTGWFAYDGGQQHIARQMYGEANLLAGSVGVGELTTHVFVNLAMQSTYLARAGGSSSGLAREGLRFATRAAEVARHEPSPRLHALVSLRQAAAYAQLGDETAFKTSIDNAHRELDRGDHPADQAWTAFVTRAEIDGHDADGWLRLEQTGRAVSRYDDVLGARLPPRNAAYYRARLAGALLEDGDRAEAIAQGLSILPDLGDRLASVRTLIELRPVRTAAQQASAEEFVALFDSAAHALSVAP